MQPVYTVMYKTAITEDQTWKQRFTTWRAEHGHTTSWRTGGTRHIKYIL